MMVVSDEITQTLLALPDDTLVSVVHLINRFLRHSLSIKAYDQLRKDYAETVEAGLAHDVALGILREVERVTGSPLNNLGDTRTREIIDEIDRILWERVGRQTLDANEAGVLLQSLRKNIVDLNPRWQLSRTRPAPGRVPPANHLPSNVGSHFDPVRQAALELHPSRIIKLLDIYDGEKMKLFSPIDRDAIGLSTTRVLFLNIEKFDSHLLDRLLEHIVSRITSVTHGGRSFMLALLAYLLTRSQSEWRFSGAYYEALEKAATQAVTAGTLLRPETGLIIGPLIAARFPKQSRSSGRLHAFAEDLMSHDGERWRKNYQNHRSQWENLETLSAAFYRVIHKETRMSEFVLAARAIASSIISDEILQLAPPYSEFVLYEQKAITAASEFQTLADASPEDLRYLHEVTHFKAEHHIREWLAN
jgi:hypothetical protein